MFRAAALWEDIFFQEHAPHLAHDEQGCAECLMEGTNFRRCCCVRATGELVHGVLCFGHEIMTSIAVAVVVVDVVVIIDVVVAAVLRAGGHCGQGGGGMGGVDVLCGVLCQMCGRGGLLLACFLWWCV
jgi:hypothetical protein